MRTMKIIKNNRLIHTAKKETIARLIVICVAVVIAVMTIAIYLTVMGYTFFYTDDYTHSGLEFPLNSSIKSILPFAIKRTAEMYQTTGGSYSSIFFEFLLDPLCFDGFHTLHFWMGVLFCYFFLSMILCLSLFFHKKQCGSIGITLLLLGICWSFINYKAWTETFFWFTGSMAYMMPLASLLYMFFFIVLAHEKKKVLFYLLSFLFGALAMGGVLCVAFVGCYGLMLLLVGYIREKSLRHAELVVFLGIFFLGLANAVAPGNYARHSLYGVQSFNVVQGIWYSIRAIVIQLEQYVKDTGFPLVLMMAFFIGFHEKKGSLRNQLGKSLIYLTFPIAALFPAIIGYGSPYMPNRVLFVSNFFLIVAMVHLIWQIGRSVAVYVNDRVGEKTVRITILLTLFAIYCAIPYRIEHGEVYKLGKASSDGQLENYYQEIVLMDKHLRNSRDKDVRVSLPDPVDGFLEFLLEDDPTYWVNREIAVYYGNSSVVRE